MGNQRGHLQLHEPARQILSRDMVQNRGPRLRNTSSTDSIPATGVLPYGGHRQDPESSRDKGENSANVERACSDEDQDCGGGLGFSGILRQEKIRRLSN